MSGTTETHFDTLPIIENSNPQDQEFEKRYNVIAEEIRQIWTDKEQIENVDSSMLSREFAIFLKEHPKELAALKNSIDTIKNAQGLPERVWKDVVDLLSDFLEHLDKLAASSVTDQFRRTDYQGQGSGSVDISKIDDKKLLKDYKKFLDKLAKPKNLHKMKEKEKENVKSYLRQDKEAANNVYTYMKNLEDTNDSFPATPLIWTGMKLDDIKVYIDIKKFLGEQYGNDEDFIDYEYHGYKQLDSRADSLKNFLGENHADWLSVRQSWEVSGVAESEAWISDNPWEAKIYWNGENILEGYLKVVPNSIVNRKAIVEKFNKCNKERNDRILDVIEKTNFTLPLDHFTKTKDWQIKYWWAEFTPDVMINNFMKELGDCIQSWDFVNEDVEKPDLIRSDNIKGGIFNKLDDYLKQQIHEIPEEKPSVDNWNGQGWLETGAEQTSSNEEFLLEGSEVKDIIKIKKKNSSLKKRITTDLKFCDKLGGEKVKFDIGAVKKYLNDIKENSRIQLNNMKNLDKETWTIAVQIALMYLNKKEWDYQSKCNVTYIDGIYKNKTEDWVLWFQKTWNEKNPKNMILPDKKSWPQTISKILQVLGDVWNAWEWWTGDAVDDVDDGANNGVDNGANDWQSIQIKIVIENGIPSLNLPDSTTLTVEQVNEICAKLKDYDKIALNLNWLESLDGNVATKLSELKWTIQIDGILSVLKDKNFVNCETQINALKILTLNGLNIYTSDWEIKSELEERGINVVDTEAVSVGVEVSTEDGVDDNPGNGGQQ